MPAQIDPRYGNPNYGFGTNQGEPVGTGAGGGGSLNGIRRYLQGGGGGNLAGLGNRFGAPTRGGGFQAGPRNPGGGWGPGYNDPKGYYVPTGGGGQAWYVPGKGFVNDGPGDVGGGVGVNYGGGGFPGYGPPEAGDPWWTLLGPEDRASTGEGAAKAIPGPGGRDPEWELLQSLQGNPRYSSPDRGPAVSYAPRTANQGDVANLSNQLNAYVKEIGGGAPGWNDAGISAAPLAGLLTGGMSPEAALNALKGYYANIKASGSNPYDQFTRSHDSGESMVREFLTGKTPDQMKTAQNAALAKMRAAEGLDASGNPIGMTPAPTGVPSTPIRRIQPTPTPTGLPSGPIRRTPPTGIATPASPTPKFATPPPLPGMTVTKPGTVKTGGGLVAGAGGGGSTTPKEGVGETRTVPGGGLNTGGEKGGTPVGTTGGGGAGAGSKLTGGPTGGLTTGGSSAFNNARKNARGRGGKGQKMVPYIPFEY